MFEKENDPTVLRSPSAGKLVQYKVEDGGHVEAGSSYAEIEVRAGPWGGAAARLPLNPCFPREGHLALLLYPQASLSSGLLCAKT